MNKSCKHCGTVFTAIAEGDEFCCHGCAHVYQVIREEGLDQYYELREGPTAPVLPSSLTPRDLRWLEAQVRSIESACGERAPEATFDLQGVSCVGCVWLIEKIFQRRPGALRIEVNAQLGRLWARWQKGRFDWPDFARELQNLGYLLGPNSKPPASESRRLLQRMGLCAAFAGNTMGFSLPRYLGMEASFPLAGLFDLLTALFATLSFVVGGSIFLQRAWAAYKAGALHIDLPIALGVTIAYGGSLAGWLLLGEEHFFYFDFVAVFLFLMLLGRWLQEAGVERNRNRLLSRSARPQAVTLETADGWRELAPVEELQSGWRLRLEKGGVCPVRSELLADEAECSWEWITGEAEPRILKRGQVTPAGVIYTGSRPIELRALESWPDSLLARLWETVPGEDRQAGMERILKVYLSVVIAAALLAVPAWGIFLGNWMGGWQAALSLLVVSCPCALGTAYPLAGELAVSRMRRFGLFVRESSLWQKLPRVRWVLFDKTGTLTLEAPQLLEPEQLGRLSREERSALWQLVAANLHPVGRSLREAMLLYPEAVDSGLQQVEETIGQGVAWRDAGGRTWRLGKPEWVAGITERALQAGDVWFGVEGKKIATFRFQEALRTEADRVLRTLQEMGYSLAILSGDRPEKVAATCRALGLPEPLGLGALSPEEKAEWVRRHAPGAALFLGDGANDALAFAAALCRGTPAADRGILEHKADFYFLGRSLCPLLELLSTARRRRLAVRMIFGFSVTYNLLAAALCLCGQMHPLLAAILMPSSSLITLAMVARTMRER